MPNEAARRVLLGYDAWGVAHVPDEPRQHNTEAACATCFSDDPICVQVQHCEIDTPVTCLACIAYHLRSLWVVLAGTIMRVDAPDYAPGDTVYYDNKAATVLSTEKGEYGQKVTIRMPLGSVITTTPGLDPRFTQR